MVHFRHGQLAHGVPRVFWVAAGVVDILNVAHVEDKSVQCGEGGREAVETVLGGEEGFSVCEVRDAMDCAASGSKGDGGRCARWIN